VRVGRATKSRFDVQLLGQANWYLQSRITQCTDKSIILDQSRYAALVLQKYLNGASDSEVTLKMKEKYATPVPSTTIFTKSDCSPTYSKVVELQQEFGFEYAAVVVSLIYLMNTDTRLNHSIRKLARFMQYPGRTHFNLLLHLLRHLQCHRLRGESNSILTSPRHLYINTSQQQATASLRSTQSWCFRTPLSKTVRIRADQQEDSSFSCKEELWMLPLQCHN
jgi:hypothetical protein